MISSFIWFGSLVYAGLETVSEAENVQLNKRNPAAAKYSKA